MPLTMTEIGMLCTVRRITGKPETRSFLEGLGLVDGCQVSVIAKNSAGIILNVRESRVALGYDVANRILV